MDHDDKIVEILLAISEDSLSQYAELPIPIKEKLKEKFLLIAESKTSYSSTQQKFTPKQVNNKNVLVAKHAPLGSAVIHRTTPTLSDSLFASNISIVEDQFVKFEITSTREGFFGGVGCLSVAAFVVLLFTGSYVNALIAMVVSIGSIYLSSITDDYILYDLKKKKLINHKQMGTSIDQVDLAPHRYIKALAVQGKKCSDKSNSWWEYYAVAITLDGDFILISDQYKEAFLDINTNLKKLGEYLNIEVLDYAQPECVLETYGSGHNLQLIYSS